MGQLRRLEGCAADFALQAADVIHQAVRPWSTWHQRPRVDQSPRRMSRGEREELGLTAPTTEISAHGDENIVKPVIFKGFFA